MLLQNIFNSGRKRKVARSSWNGCGTNRHKWNPTIISHSLEFIRFGCQKLSNISIQQESLNLLKLAFELFYRNEIYPILVWLKDLKTLYLFMSSCTVFWDVILGWYYNTFRCKYIIIYFFSWHNEKKNLLSTNKQFVYHLFS